jgi:hypothetical protein
VTCPRCRVILGGYECGDVAYTELCGCLPSNPIPPAPHNEHQQDPGDESNHEFHARSVDHESRVQFPEYTS